MLTRKPGQRNHFLFPKSQKKFHAYHAIQFPNLLESRREYYHCPYFVAEKAGHKTVVKLRALICAQPYLIPLKGVYCAFPGNISFDSHKNLIKQANIIFCPLEVYSITHATITY